MSQDPFDLAQSSHYERWRSGKLANYPATTDDLRVRIGDLAHPDAREQEAIRERIRAFNMALVATDPEQVTPSMLLAFGRTLGLHRSDANLFADAQAVSAIAQATPGLHEADVSREKGEFIPYTNRPLQWHTDGYYNAPDRQVHAWLLFCARPAAEGGENQLLDHEIAYLHLRDASLDHIRALSHPRALTIPVHQTGTRIIRHASTGPVFSYCDRFLHMRYSARRHHVDWLDTQQIKAAREALDELFSLRHVFTFNHKLDAGEGLIANNVLHARSGFSDGNVAGNHGRLLYRIRYLDRIAVCQSPADTVFPSFKVE